MPATQGRCGDALASRDAAADAGGHRHAAPIWFWPIKCTRSACVCRPDHDTLATFRQRFGQAFEAVFVEVLQVARENPLSRFGRVSLDGANVPEGMSVPAELKRREDRSGAIATAKGKIEARAAERFAHEQGDYEAKLAAREAKAKASGKNPGGQAPQPPEPGPRATDQINLTDEASRIMVVAGGGFEQCDNAQAIVATETLLVLVPQVTQAANDQQQVVPMDVQGEWTLACLAWRLKRMAVLRPQ